MCACVYLVFNSWLYCQLLMFLFFHSVSVQWKRLHINNEPPVARAYHSLTCIGSRYLLFGGFDGKATYGDLWWLVPEGIKFWLVLEYLNFEQDKSRVMMFVGTATCFSNALFSVSKGFLNSEVLFIPNITIHTHIYNYAWLLDRRLDCILYCYLPCACGNFSFFKKMGKSYI